MPDEFSGLVPNDGLGRSVGRRRGSHHVLWPARGQLGASGNHPIGVEVPGDLGGGVVEEYVRVVVHENGVQPLGDLAADQLVGVDGAWCQWTKGARTRYPGISRAHSHLYGFGQAGFEFTRLGVGRLPVEGGGKLNQTERLGKSGRLRISRVPGCNHRLRRPYSVFGTAISG
jgi:hypothetical protein